MMTFLLFAPASTKWLGWRKDQKSWRDRYLFHLLYGIRVKIFIMNRYISKSYTTSKNTIDRQYTERGVAVVSTITSIRVIAVGLSRCNTWTCERFLCFQHCTFCFPKFCNVDYFVLGQPWVVSWVVFKPKIKWGQEQIGRTINCVG